MSQERTLNIKPITADELEAMNTQEAFFLLMATADAYIALVWPLKAPDELTIMACGGQIQGWVNSYSPSNDEPYAIAGVFLLGHVQQDTEGWKAYPFALGKTDGFVIPADADLLIINEPPELRPQVFEAIRSQYVPSRLAQEDV